MGLVAQSVVVQGETAVKQETQDLTSSEIEALLNLIKKSTFVGQDVEMVYNLVVKLQKQYLQKNKQ
jgi:ribosomal protein S13